MGAWGPHILKLDTRADCAGPCLGIRWLSFAALPCLALALATLLAVLAGPLVAMLAGAVAAVLQFCGSLFGMQGNASGSSMSNTPVRYPCKPHFCRMTGPAMPDGQIVYIPLVWLGHVVCGELIYLLSWRTNGCGPCMR